MKGLVFTEFLDMVEDTYSPRTADAILSRHDLPSGGAYTAVGTYDSAEMSLLVSSLSDEVGEPPEALLRAFGQWLFTRFHGRYPSLFPPGQSLAEFLAGIDSVIHVEVRKLYPDAETPSIEAFQESGGDIVVRYTSPREMPDLAEGLLRGALDHFAVEGAITREVEPGLPPTTVFRMSIGPRRD